MLFSFKLLDATKNGPQMAVFSNGLMAGLIQLWGTAETNSAYPWKKTYRLYIPRELLAAGRNVLTLKSCRPMWSDASVDGRLWWRWDYLRLESLAAPVREPIHGSPWPTWVRRSSIVPTTSSSTTTRCDWPPWHWSGWASPTAATRFAPISWDDVAHLQPRRLEYLKLLADLNMTVAVDNVSSGHFHNRPDGSMPQDKKEAIAQFFATYGNYVQWYEIANEPCMFGGGMAETLNVARWVNQVKPSHVQTTAPGWAYGGGRGTPANWDADAANRRRVEALCQATNGHSYGFSYADNRGGSFVENLRTFGGVDDGWPKPSLNTETGTNDWHSEENGTRFASTQPHAQAFDRILRAHLAVVERTMQHAAIFDDFGLFKGPFDAKNPTALRAFPGMKGEDSRLKTFRRLALAYATHARRCLMSISTPTPFAGGWSFCAVDTAALPALPGSGGTSNRVLLNFVNFENHPQKVEVRVTMPEPGTYRGPRFGVGETYAQVAKGRDAPRHADRGHHCRIGAGRCRPISARAGKAPRSLSAHWSYGHAGRRPSDAPLGRQRLARHSIRSGGPGRPRVRLRISPRPPAVLGGMGEGPGVMRLSPRPYSGEGQGVRAFRPIATMGSRTNRPIITRSRPATTRATVRRRRRRSPRSAPRRRRKGFAPWPATGK